MLPAGQLVVPWPFVCKNADIHRTYTAHHRHDPPSRVVVKNHGCLLFV